MIYMLIGKYILFSKIKKHLNKAKSKKSFVFKII
jgi:hypothetical protein